MKNLTSYVGSSLGWFVTSAKQCLVNTISNCQLHTRMSIILQLDDRYILRIPNADVQFDPCIRNAIGQAQSDWRLLSVCVCAGALPSLLIFFISRANEIGGEKNRWMIACTPDKPRDNIFTIVSKFAITRRCEKSSS